MDDVITILIFASGLLLTLLFLGMIKFKLMADDFVDEVSSDFKDIIHLLVIISENRKEFNKINDMMLKLDTKYQELADKVAKPISERGLHIK
ncbi:MAG: hypothetical protein M0P71_07590 [Melioribacteraceae bacterium]|jgi:hypothetical protein|nr:hypothetical protein [Melioribacteraceae bacterium]